MFLVAPRFCSPGARYRMHLRLPPRPRAGLRPTHLVCGFTNAAGRTRQGGKTIWSKGARYAPRKFVAALFSPKGARLLGLVYGLFWQPKTRTTLALVKNSVGAWFFSPSPGGLMPLAYFSVVPGHATFQALKGVQPRWWWPLTLLPPYTRAALFPRLWGQAPRLVRAPGSTALVLTSLLWGKWALLVLPSGQLFLAHNTHHVLLGGLSPAERRGAFCGTAGSQRRRGFSPRVRGVAMNPNDHPHGGRTKAVKYPRTP